MSKRDEDLIEEGREFTEEELEQYFREAEEEEAAPRPFIASPAFRKLVVAAVGLVMVIQVLAWWPQIFSLDAIRFLQASAQLSQSEEIKIYKESVVVIRTEDSKGTGFIISGDGWIVTNRHVVDGDAQPTVSLANGDRYPAEVTAVSDTVDLALLHIDAEQLPALSLSDRYTGESGFPIYVIGNPLFFTGIANEGEAIGLSATDPPMMVLQAPVYRGNSGSPVIDRDGEVVGVVYATSSVMINGQDTKIGLAVPVEWVFHLLAAEGKSLDAP